MQFKLFCLALVAACAVVNAGEGVVELTAENFGETTQSGYWLVKFFAPWCGHCKKMAPTWDHLGKELAGKANIAKIDCTQHKDKCGEFGVKGFPTIKLLKDGAEAEAFKGARTATSFVKFLQEHAELSADVVVKDLPGTEARPPPKKEAPVEEGPSDVVNLSAADLEKLEGDWFVKFYAPWCGHCKKLAPKWSHLATELKGKANIAKVDCTVHGDACGKFGIKGYPTLKLLSGTEEKAAYSGGRDVESFAKFLKAQGVIAEDTVVKAMTGGDKQQPPQQPPKKEEEGPSDVTVLTDDTFGESTKSGYWFVKFYAPWCGHCKKLAPAWSHIATELKGKTNIAKVDCTEQKKVCGDQGVRGYPTLKLFKDGVEVEKYQSGRDVNSFVTYLKEKGAIDSSVSIKPFEAPRAGAPKKEAPKEEEKTDVVVLGADNFAAQTSTGAWFVKFYAPWCGHCKRLSPVWNELATAFNTKAGTPVKIAKVDCTIHKDICKDNGVKGYPTLKLLTPGADAEGYRGGRDLAALTSFLEGKGLTAPAAPAHTEL